jgi:hypothetical protein
MQLKYRSALPEDAPECVAARGKTRENALSREQLRTIGITAKSWAENIHSGAVAGYICTFAGNIVGYCFGAPDTGEIEVLVVLPDFENRGILVAWLFSLFDQQVLRLLQAPGLAVDGGL